MSDKPKTQKEKLDALWTALLGINGELGFVGETRAFMAEVREGMKTISKALTDHISDPERAVDRFLTKEGHANLEEAKDKKQGEKKTLNEAKKLTATERRLLIWAILGTIAALFGIGHGIMNALGAIFK